MTKYRGPSVPFAEFNHRTLAEVHANEIAASRLEDRRIRLGWTYYRLSQIAGVDQNTLTAALTGQSRPSDFTVGLIAQALDRGESTSIAKTGGSVA